MKYSDTDDRLTTSFIADEYGEPYWGESEDRVLDLSERYLLKHFGLAKLKTLNFLDLGAGIGRLLPRFAPSAGKVIALEVTEK